VTHAWSVTLDADATLSNAVVPPVGVRATVARIVLAGWPVTMRTESVT